MSEVHGKFHSDSEYYAAEKYGTQYTGKIGEITVPPTQKQLDAQQRFATARQNVAALSEAFSISRGILTTKDTEHTGKETMHLTN